MPSPLDGSETHPPELNRALTLPLVVLYGLGVTVGAGIYVLIGQTAAVAGIYSPLSFVLAALVMLPSACSFAELVGRLPVSAGEAAYVRHGLNSKALSVAVGLLVVAAGTVSAAAICVGSVGYIRQFIDWHSAALIPLVVIFMTLIASWGVRESVSFAAVMTLIEIGGLVVIIGAGLMGPSLAWSEITTITSDAPSTGMIAFGILSGGVLAFFAFIGFEDLVNMAEETKSPAKILPRAIFLTLIISTVLYVLVAIVAILNVPIRELGVAEAPLSLVFEKTANASPATISAIAIIATLNGVIVQIIMGARVLYGLSRQGSLPGFFSYIHPATRTPLIASTFIGALVMTLALLVPLRGLAEMTSQITLIVFALVNMALWNIKRRGEAAPLDAFTVPDWVPIAGMISCLAFLIIAQF